MKKCICAPGGVRHKDLVEIFKSLLNFEVIRWWKKGPNSVRIRTQHRDYIFTYINPNDWKVETIKSYEKSVV